MLHHITKVALIHMNDLFLPCATLAVHCVTIVRNVLSADASFITELSFKNRRREVGEENDSSFGRLVRKQAQ